jgi:hypothetical protein
LDLCICDIGLLVQVKALRFGLCQGKEGFADSGYELMEERLQRSALRRLNVEGFSELKRGQGNGRIFKWLMR